jgi:hypothetical protein
MAGRRGVEVFTAFCESHTSQVPFRAVARLLRAATGVEGLDGQTARDRVRDRVAGADPEDLLLLDDLWASPTRMLRYRQSIRLRGTASPPLPRTADRARVSICLHVNSIKALPSHGLRSGPDREAHRSHEMRCASNQGCFRTASAVIAGAARQTIG